jgi:hypothetical protein
MNASSSSISRTQHGTASSPAGSRGSHAVVPSDDLEALAHGPHEQRVGGIEAAGPHDLRLDLVDDLGALEQPRVVGMRVELGQRHQDGRGTTASAHQKMPGSQGRLRNYPAAEVGGPGPRWTLPPACGRATAIACTPYPRSRSPSRALRRSAANTKARPLGGKSHASVVTAGLGPHHQRLAPPPAQPSCRTRPGGTLLARGRMADGWERARRWRTHPAKLAKRRGSVRPCASRTSQFERLSLVGRQAQPSSWAPRQTR